MENHVLCYLPKKVKKKKTTKPHLQLKKKEFRGEKGQWHPSKCIPVGIGVA